VKIGSPVWLTQPDTADQAQLIAGTFSIQAPGFWVLEHKKSRP